MQPQSTSDSDAGSGSSGTPPAAVNAHHQVFPAFSTWAAWAGPADRAAIKSEGHGLFEWAVDQHARFFSDEWIARQASQFNMPMMNLYEWPMSSPIAVIYLLERAARIALLTPEAYKVLTEGPNGIRRSNDNKEFDHLDLILELFGLATRDGWACRCEVETPDGRYPDLNITRGSMAYTIEVTLQGTDRDFRNLEEQSHRINRHRDELQAASPVDVTARITRLLLDDELASFLEALGGAAVSCVAENTQQEVAVDGASGVVYPKGSAPEGVPLFEGPASGEDMWPRFARRLHEKAKRTEHAGPTWIRIDEGGGLLMLTSVFHLPMEQQANVLLDHVHRELGGYEHVRGVLLSTGTAVDWVPNQPQRTFAEQHTGGAVHEYRLPGGRRRRTFVLPVRVPKIVLPAHLELNPGNWYRDEPGWLDWALNHLGWPSPTLLVTGEAARKFIV